MKSIFMLFYSILIGGVAIANTGSSNERNVNGANPNGTTDKGATINEKLLRSFGERFPDAQQGLADDRNR
jgi:hypothetical protein